MVVMMNLGGSSSDGCGFGGNQRGRTPFSAKKILDREAAGRQGGYSGCGSW